MALDFPASPTTGQTFTAAGVVWTWDGAKWTASGLSIAYVPMAGYVPAMNDNRIINGDMRIDQRNAGAAGTAIGYTIDRWDYSASQVAKGNWQRGNPAPAPSAGFPYALLFVSTSAYASLAADIFNWQQPIEADMISDFQWGTANAQPVTLSFWAFSSQAGTFSGAIANYATTRSYPFSYSIPAANTWAKIVVTIPGDTAGTWVMSGNAGAAYLTFDLGSGANYRGPANAWASGFHVGVTGAASVVGTNGANFLLTGVKLEIGSTATPFNRQSLAKSMADCQRYYQTGGWGIGGNAAPGEGEQSFFSLPVVMRTTPTIAYGVDSSSNVSTGAPYAYSNAYMYAYATSVPGGGYFIYGSFTASAEL